VTVTVTDTPAAQAQAPTGDAPETVAAPRAAGRVRARNAFAAVWPPTVFLGLLFGLWYLVHYVLLSGSRRFLVPLPGEVWDKAFADGATRRQLLDGLRTTTKVSFTGFAIAIVLGVLFGTLMSQAKWIERSFYPWAILLQTVPILALVPLITLWFGYSFNSRVIVVVIIALFPIITNTLFGLLSVQDEYHDLFTLHRAPRLTRLCKLEFPAALPAMFTGFRISAGLSVIGAVVGEFFFRQGDKGLGQLIDGYRRGLRIAELFGGIFWTCTLGVAVFLLFGWFGQLVSGSWHESSRQAS
jgi:NitT/TauT family transport system permease protein